MAGLEECNDFMRSLPGIEVIEVGTSAGGRPILAAAYGEREPLNRTSTSLSSSTGGLGPVAWNVDKSRPVSFFGDEPRQKQVVVFQGNIHGAEIEGTVAAMNVLNLLAHGTDLRGQRHDRLLEEARKTRLIVIPHANPDGRARWEPARQLQTASKKEQQGVVMGCLPDGSPLAYGPCKGVFPIPVSEKLGAYYNDDGVNLNHDRFLDSDRAPETDALLRFYLQEMPDAAILAHTDTGTLLTSAPEYVPAEVQGVYARIAGAVISEMRRRKLPVFSYPHAARPGGMMRAFTQSDAVYHQCGANAFCVEFPRSVEGNVLSFDTVLDIGLCVIESILIYGNDLGFRPCLRKHLIDGRIVTKYGKLTEV